MTKTKVIYTDPQKIGEQAANLAQDIANVDVKIAIDFFNEFLETYKRNYKVKTVSKAGGRDTNWSLFKESLRKLLAQYGRNGITPRTYRIVHGGVSAIGLIPGHES